MSGISVDLESVVQRLSSMVGNQAAEIAMRDAALEAAHARITELEAEKPDKEAPRD